MGIFKPLFHDLTIIFFWRTSSGERKMARLSGKRLFCLLLVASMMAACSAAAAADPAIDSKPSAHNSAKAVEKDENRESHSLKSDVSYANYLKPPIVPAPVPAPALPQAAPAAHSIPVPVYSNPHETTMGYVYYYLPQTVEKYYPKFRDLMPFLKKKIASRAWPVMRQAADRTFDLTSAVGLVLLAPALLISSILFLGFMVILFIFPAVSAFGRRRMGRDLSAVDDNNEVFDFDSFLPPEQSRTLASLAARVDNVLENYMRALKSDTCLERFSCEAGQITSRFGKFTEPIIT